MMSRHRSPLTSATCSSSRALLCCALLAASLGGCSSFAGDDAKIDPLVLTPTIRDADTTITGATALHMLDDLNGDGAQEVAVVSERQDASTLRVFLSPVRGTLDAANASFTVTAPANRIFGKIGATAKDLDGDGARELLVLAPDHQNSESAVFKGALYVFKGALPTDGRTLSSDDAAMVLWTGRLVTSEENMEVADLTGDGVPDLITSNSAGVDLVEGPFTHLQTLRPTLTLRGEAGHSLGGQIAVGDFNGDGAPDLAVSAPGPTTAERFPGAVFFWRGPLEAGEFTSESADAVWQGKDGNRGVGMQLVPLGDADGDGRDDLAISAMELYAGTSKSQHGGRVFVVSGEPAKQQGDILTEARAVYEGPLVGDLVGWKLGAGDLNGDGVVDLVTTSSRQDIPSSIPLAPRPVYVVYGPHRTSDAPRSLATADHILMEGSKTDYASSVGVAIADVSGDGRADLLIGASGVKASEDEERASGRLFIFTEPL